MGFSEGFMTKALRADCCGRIFNIFSVFWLRNFRSKSNKSVGEFIQRDSALLSCCGLKWTSSTSLCVLKWGDKRSKSSVEVSQSRLRCTLDLKI